MCILWVILTHTPWDQVCSQPAWELRSCCVPCDVSSTKLCIFEPLVKICSELWSPLLFWRLRPTHVQWYTLLLELIHISCWGMEVLREENWSGSWNNFYACRSFLQVTVDCRGETKRIMMNKIENWITRYNFYQCCSSAETEHCL